MTAHFSYHLFPPQALIQFYLSRPILCLYFLSIYAQCCTLIDSKSPPTPMLNAVKVNPQVRQQSSLLFHKPVTLSSVRCPPQTSARCGSQLYLLTFKKPHLRRCMGGSRDPYLPLIFILPQQWGWWSCQLKPSVNLPEKPTRDNNHHICMLRAAGLI